MLREITWVADIWVNPRVNLADAMTTNRFPLNRTDESLADERRFPAVRKKSYPLIAKRTRVPPGYEEDDIPLVMKEIRARDPQDIREILALGQEMVGLSFTYHIFAPSLTGDVRRFIKFTALSTEPGFGLGIMPPFHHEDVEHGGLSLCDHNFLWFVPE